MASKAFSQIANNMKLSKNVESVIVGGPALGEGVHDVTILAVDTTAADEDKLTVVYSDADGKTYTDRMFMLSSDKTEVSFGLRALWSGVLQDRESIAKLIDMADQDNKAFEMLTGMKARITLVQGKGVQARSTGTGTYAGYDVESNTKVTEDFSELKEVYDYCKGNALKRSFLQVKKVEAIDKDGNLAAFKFAVAAKEGATVSQLSAAK